MYPINKYLFEDIFEKNNDLYQEFMCAVDTEYIDTIDVIKHVKTISEIRSNIHKLLSIVINLVDKNYEMIYYCKLVLFIDKSETDIKWYSEYIKMILAYNKSQLGLYELPLPTISYLSEKNV
jgi:organic radical activating enzyme